jgi:hypothetical protein
MEDRCFGGEPTEMNTLGEGGLRAGGSMNGGGVEDEEAERVVTEVAKR